MPIKKQGWLLLLAIFLLLALVTAFVLMSPSSTIHFTLLRLCGLYGFILLSVATSITPFLKEVTMLFGKPFMRIHHVFAVVGIIAITLHPILLAARFLNPGVFLPRFDDWFVFWQNAGRPALVIIYVAVLAALLMRKAPRHWRSFHALMYVALLFGVVHAGLVGTDMANYAVTVVVYSLFAFSMFVFFLKRYRSYRLKRRVTPTPA
jgi:hypothetical protein